MVGRLCSIGTNESEVGCKSACIHVRYTYIYICIHQQHGLWIQLPTAYHIPNFGRDVIVNPPDVYGGNTRSHVQIHMEDLGKMAFASQLGSGSHHCKLLTSIIDRKSIATYVVLQAFNYHFGLFCGFVVCLSSTFPHVFPYVLCSMSTCARLPKVTSQQKGACRRGPRRKRGALGGWHGVNPGLKWWWLEIQVLADAKLAYCITFYNSLVDMSILSGL